MNLLATTPNRVQQYSTAAPQVPPSCDLLVTTPDLLQRFRDGHKAALETVYRAYVGTVTRITAALLRRNSGTAWFELMATGELPDLVQEIFVRAFSPQARRRFDGVRDYAPYLGSIARNVVVDYLRSRRRQTVTSQVVASMSDLSRDDGTDAEADVPRELVTRYLNGLPADVRRVHELLHVEGLSQREAAATLGVGRQVIRTLEGRLREGLLRELMAVGCAVNDGARPRQETR
jgi:RNA polymerase sigma-70 factor (ECF subfamily)